MLRYTCVMSKKICTACKDIMLNMLYITNTEKNAEDLAKKLIQSQVVIFPFSDGEQSHFDILMAYNHDGIEDKINKDKLIKATEKFGISILRGKPLKAILEESKGEESLTRLQRGVKTTDLFVCIMSIGAFGFGVRGNEGSIPLHPNYVAGKLNFSDDAVALTELLSNVRKNLRRYYNYE